MELFTVCKQLQVTKLALSMVRVFPNLFLADYTPARSLTSAAMKELISVAISVDAAECAYCYLFSDK